MIPTPDFTVSKTMEFNADADLKQKMEDLTLSMKENPTNSSRQSKSPSPRTTTPSPKNEQSSENTPSPKQSMQTHKQSTPPKKDTKHKNDMQDELIACKVVKESHYDGRSEVVLEVLNSHVGRIIGRGGSRIREIEYQTSASVQLSKAKEHEPFGPYTIRTVTVTGTRDEVEHCRSILEDAISQPKDARRFDKEDSTTEERHILIPVDRVVRVAGRNGQLLQFLQEETGAEVTLDLEKQNEKQDASISIKGTRPQVSRCERLIIERISGHDHPKHGPSRLQDHDYELREDLTNSPKISHHGPVSVADMRSAIVRIPTESVGRVIGKKGIHIRQIQERSGAVVHLPKANTPGMNFREMVITGSEQQISSCVGILQSIMTPPGSPMTNLVLYPNTNFYQPQVVSYPVPYEYYDYGYEAVAPSPMASQATFVQPVQPAYGYVPYDPRYGMTYMDQYPTFVPHMSPMLGESYPTPYQTPLNTGKVEKKFYLLV
eukprot:m.52821 g.52821  ORF g.52821 m.52821 type:complete len:489 (-) comp10821_c0_seq1:3763-5229(-)